MQLQPIQIATAQNLAGILTALLAERTTLLAAKEAVDPDAPTTAHCRAEDAVAHFDVSRLLPLLGENHDFLAEIANRYRSDLEGRISAAIAPFVAESARADFVRQNFEPARLAARRGQELTTDCSTQGRAFPVAGIALETLALVLAEAEPIAA